jgi:4-hydroxy-tetrahydrodipicolinate synthase
MKSEMKGLYTALATPFDARGEIDWSALDRLLEQQIQSGIRGFVACGTTGESPTLTKAEKEKVFRRVFEFSQKHGADAVAGTGTNDSRESIELTRLAQSVGYRRFLVVTPYYNKPSQVGLRKHFEAIAESCTGEVVLYNVPGRSGISIAPETVVELAAHPRIRAIKEASGNLATLSEIRAGLAQAGRSMALLSGDDATYLPFLFAGGQGSISVASHVCPRAMLRMEKAVLGGDVREANRIQDRFLPIFRDLFLEANPCPLKWFLARLGFGANSLRLPLVPVSAATEAKLEKLLASYRIENGELVE